MASIRKRGDTYFVDYYVNGRRVRKSVGKTLQEAQEALKEIESRQTPKPVNVELKNYPLAQIVGEFQSYSKVAFSPNTQSKYNSIINNFINFLSEYYPDLNTLSYITTTIIEDFKKRRQQQGADNRTINAELIVLSMMFRLAIQWGFARENPAQGIAKLPESKRETPRFLTKDEARELLDNCDPWVYSIFYTFLNAGLRKGELENLQWSDVDLKKRIIKIFSTNRWTPKSFEREIPINEGLLKVLKKQKELTGSGELVFPDEKGGKIHHNRLRRILMRLTKKLGFEDVTHIYMLRHTFAAELIKQGVDLNTVRTLMGHGDIKTTMIYSELASINKNKAVEGLDYK